jgi:4-amino-4-deoxy-L-arabinose transferase-like glycosyltransferase
MAAQPNSSARSTSSTDLAFTIAVAVVALLPRLFISIAWAREPVWDGHYYHFGAERIALGLGYSEDVLLNGELVWKPWSHYPVGYSAFLAIFYRVFGSGLIVAPVVGALIGTAVTVVVHRLARHFVSEGRARFAAALTALHPGLIVYSAVVMTEQFAALLWLLAGLFAARWRGRWTGALAAGAALGAAILVRPTSLLAAPLLLLMQPRPLSRALLQTAATVSLALALAAPWTIRNCMRMDGCAFVSTNAGWNLAIGALTETGRFQTLRAADGCAIVTGQVQQDRCFWDLGMQIIARDPLAWVARIPMKLSQTFDHESFPVEYLHEADPEAWPDSRRTAARGLLTGFHRLLVVLAAFSVVGWVGFRRPKPFPRTEVVVQAVLLCALVTLSAAVLLSEPAPVYMLVALLPLIGLLPLPGRPRFGPAGRYLLALVASTAFVHALFFGDDRYHVVISPVLCILAAGALRAGTTRVSPLT